jgi:hypothetical protein
MNTSSTGIGFSVQSVPSLSNTAIRSSSGTASGPLVTRPMKSVMAALVGVSFQDERSLTGRS